MTRNRRPWVAVAAALGATVALVSPASGAGQAVTDPLATWAKGVSVTVAPGVTHTTWTETDLIAGNRAKARKLQIVEIDPTAGSLTLESTVGTKDGSAEQVSDQLTEVTTVPFRHPYAGVNGGLFQREPAGAGVEKTAAHTGVSATDGVLHSSSCWNDDKGTTGAVIQYGIPYITKLLTDMKLIGPSGEDIRIDDVNRTPGRPPHCARDSEDMEVTTSPPVYTDADEIVVFTDDYGLPTPKPKTDPLVAATADPGFEVVVDAHGVVTRAREGRGGTEVPEGGRIIQGIGTGAQWLRDRLVLDDRVTIDQKLRDVTLGRNIPLDDSVDVVSSFHQLLRHSVIPTELPNSCSGTEKGAVDATKPICTDSRTALGTNSKGHPVLVTLTGQDNEDGDYLRSFAALLDSPLLGIVDALNLDGGGSTVLLTKVPSADPTKTATIHTPPTDLEDGKLVHRKVADSVYAGVGGYGLYTKP
ncbi:phosphodiester glycosidase family protein [Streptomyces sp. NPDC056943]|uniref:phosphodiester glycosidase family protein n=1 Tax=Streptomyces sp. NPDC056943 TaxID=3345971 RepID=UPI00362E22C1